MRRVAATGSCAIRSATAAPTNISNTTIGVAATHASDIHQLPTRRACRCRSVVCRGVPSDLDSAVEFLQRAFGLTVDEKVYDDRGALRLATVGRGDGRVPLQPDLPNELHGSHVGQAWVYVAVADVDAQFRRAEAEGAEVLNKAPRRVRGVIARLQRQRP